MIALVFKPRTFQELTKPRYVKLILALIAIWWIGFFFVDNIFYDRAAGQFATADQLASFLGTYFIITGFIGLITTTFLSGPIISRFGLRAGLAIMPVLLLIGIGASAILGTVNSTFAALFWLIAISKSLNIALGFSIAQSGQIMLYQPLAAESRGRIQTFGEGIIQPIAIGVAAVLLLLFNTVLGFHAIQLSYLFVIIGAIWLVIIVLIMREYPQALSRALAKRNLGETTLNFADKNYLDMLRKGLQSPFPASAIYSLNLLARTDRSAFLDSLSDTLWHPAPEVRRETLTQIEQMLLASATPIVQQIAADDPDINVRADALRTLVSIGDDAEFKHVAQFLSDPDRTLQRGALIGLLRYSYPESIQKLINLIQSPNLDDRILAAQVLGEARRRDMDIPLPTLLRDPEPQVRRAALNAIRHIKPLGAWPDVIAALDDPRARSTARLALISGGELALPAIQAAWDSGRTSHTQLIALGHVAGHIGGADVIDTLRALRCADALRQRGTTLKTSVRYEVFIDQGNAQAVYAMRYDDERLYLVSISQPVSVGEANLASCELDAAGNLRFSFHRGAFGNSQAVQYAVHCAALVMNDIQADVIQSFQRPATPSGPIGSLKPASSMQIFIEGVDDNLNFADLVHAELIQINPDLNSQTKTVPSLQHVFELERTRYLAATELDWSIDQRRELLKKVEESGHKTAKIDPELGFRHVRLSTLLPKETLLEAGAPDGFVYIPLTDGLSIIPLGGYDPFAVKAWMPLGVTGVIRGAMRNASIVAEEEVQLLMIPREVFLKRWHFTYSFKELIDRLSPAS
jgi:HEAT repeat protein